MMYQPVGTSGANLPIPAAVIRGALYTYRDAREGGRPAQPALHAMLSPAGLGMLAPAFDSLMRLCECCLDRPLCKGCLVVPSTDEQMLCRLLADPDHLPGLGRFRTSDRDGIRRALISALASIRLMLATREVASLQVEGLFQ